LGTLSDAVRTAAILAMGEALLARKDEIMAANAADVAEAAAGGLSGPLLQRLKLSEKTFRYMAARLAEVAALPDPLGVITRGHTRPSGLRVQRVSVPLGVIGIIYESRHNVTTDAAGVCVKSGNAVILRGGSEGHFSEDAAFPERRSASRDARGRFGCLADASQEARDALGFGDHGDERHGALASRAADVDLERTFQKLGPRPIAGPLRRGLSSTQAAVLATTASSTACSGRMRGLILLAGPRTPAYRTVCRRAPDVPCLVLLDLKMPRLGGHEFRRAQLGDPIVASVRIAVMSGATDLEQRAQALGAVATVAKPIDFDRLLEIVNRYCA
jgi:CheY-like chemotaxis protein